MLVVVTPDAIDTVSMSPAADIIDIELARTHPIRLGSGVKAASARLVRDAPERRGWRFPPAGASGWPAAAPLRGAA
jgi:hypothetical protein